MKRPGGRTLVGGALVAVLLFWWSIGAVHSMQDKGRVAKMTETMKTVCVGRFLIDLPASADVSLGRAFIHGFDITSQKERKEDFLARLAARELAINSASNSLGRRNMESVKEVQGDGYFGKIFVYGRWRTHWNEGEKRLVAENVAISGYLFANGVSYDFASDGYSPNRTDSLARLISQFKPNPGNAVLSDPGFCIDGAIFLDPMVASQRERVVMFAGLPGHPDIAIAFSTMAGTRPGQSMLARNAAAAANEPLYVRAAFKTLREKNRTINGLAGEELALRVREPNFATTFSFDWEMVGKQDDVLAPLLTLEMESGVRPRPGAKPVQSSLSEESLVALWDRISSTIRVRPTTPPKLAKAAPPLRPLGTLASAGDLCPQDGWWQCNDGGSGLRVLGGQRQYLKKGQRIPQALLLPSQTVWEKVRGLQRSVEASTPTLWKLVDNRATPRGAPKVPLAQATLVPRADARDVTTPTIIAGDSNLPVGSYVRTGEPCPASGWWRCEQSHALDGTRWFAHGSLLPAATFKVPPGVFGRSSGGPEVIQRRSSWQLVRYAHAEHEGRAGNAGAGDDPGGGTASGPESAV